MLQWREEETEGNHKREEKEKALLYRGEREELEPTEGKEEWK